MPQTAIIVNKGIQIILSREEAVNLAQTGSAVVPVKDPSGKRFGEASVVITALCQAAILEHLDLPIPTVIRKAMQTERIDHLLGG
jgi:hypothetical protein